MAYSQPELFERLIDVLTEATIDYLAAQVEAGAEVVMLFDSLGRRAVAAAVPRACDLTTAGGSCAALKAALSGRARHRLSSAGGYA